MIVQQGSINLAAAQVPGVIVQIVPPAVTPILGVPSGGMGVVGTAAWGPVNSPTVAGSYAEYTVLFGPLVNRVYDAGTEVAIGTQLGVTNFTVVRVTDGTDTAASATLGAVGSAFAASLTGLCSGSLGNAIVATMSGGTKAGTWKFSIALPGMVPEVFDNIAGTGAAFWSNLVSAVNNGTGPNRGASQVVAATLGTLTSTAPAAGSSANGGSGILSAFSGGADGAASITPAILMGTDGTGASRTGAYALRGTGVGVVDVAGLTDTTEWANLAALALSESQYPVVAFPPGNSITATTTAMATLGIDTPWLKIMHGDWVWWADAVNGVTRLVSPAAFVGACLANQAPNQSSLNKPLAAIVGTQKTAANQVYSNADLLALMEARVDVVTLPSAGGQNYFAAAFGINCSSNEAVNGDDYTRMTNFLAPTLNKAMGIWIGKLQSAAQRRDAFAMLDQFMCNLWQQGLVGNADGDYPNGPQPWSVTLDATNNPPSRVALGFEQADMAVQYLSVIDNLLINLQAGQSVQITRAAVAS